MLYVNMVILYLYFCKQEIVSNNEDLRKRVLNVVSRVKKILRPLSETWNDLLNNNSESEEDDEEEEEEEEEEPIKEEDKDDKGVDVDDDEN